MELMRPLFRQIFSKMVEGSDNAQRGEIVREILKEEANKSLKTDNCYICGNIIDTQNKVIDKIIRKIEDENIEFSTFLIGSRISIEILNKEEEIKKRD